MTFAPSSLARPTRPSRIVPLLLAAVLLAGVAPSHLAAQSAAPASAAALSERERELAARLKVETVREITERLAAPEMQGRGTMQPGGDRAAEYIAERFRQLGLKPLGDKGTYLQRIEFRESVATPESSFKSGDAKLAVGRDYVSITRDADKSVSGRVVFVGYGVTSEQLKRNDLRGIDVQNKIVVFQDDPPKNVREEDWKKIKATRTIIRNLIFSGAAAVVIAGGGDAQHPYAELADYLTRRGVDPASEAETPARVPPLLMVSDAGAEKLFAGSEMTYAQAKSKIEAGEYASLDLKKPATINLRVKKTKGASSNVVGYLEGSDPLLKQEAVVYTAHYDAYGIGADGRIYPGAADNALGVAEMIAAAEAFAKSPERPRRSLVFLAVTGEEYGLHGAEHWVKHPTWDIKRVAADFNYDGIGTEVYGRVRKVVGFGAEHSDLGQALAEVAAATSTQIVPDPMPEEKVFYRSDHYAFVKKGIPALMLMGAPDITTEKLIERIKRFEREDYHQPTDTVRPDWEWQGARDIAVIGLLIGARVADRDEMPKWLTTSPYDRKRGTNEEPPEEN